MAILAGSLPFCLFWAAFHLFAVRNFAKILMRFFFPVFIFCLFFQFSGRAKGTDSTFVKDCRFFYNLTLSLTKPVFSSVLSSSADDLRLKYRTLNPYRLGLAFDYRWFGLELTTNLPTLKSQNIRKGKTQSSSFRFTINSRKVAVLAFFQNYNGFYLSDDRLFYDPLSPENPLPKRPDMDCVFFLGQAQYIFNHRRYSNPAAAGQYERQLKSSGTPVASIGYQYAALSGGSSFIPAEFQSQFPNLSRVKGIVSSQIFAGIGYQHTFIWWKKYFLNASFMPAATWFQNKEVLDKNVNRAYVDFGLRYDTRLVLGHNGERLYYGAWFSGLWSNQRLMSGNFIDHTYQTFRFFAGWRFRTKKNLGFLGL